MARSGAWSRCAYRVRPNQKTAPTHAELVRLVERLSNKGVEVAFWSGDDGAEATLFEQDEIAAAAPGGPVRRGSVIGRPIKAVVQELVAGDPEAVAQARAAAAAVEAQQRAAAQERERAAAAAVEAQQRAVAQERERVAKLEREHAAAQERERVARQERERFAAVEAQQRAVALDRERAAAIEAQRREAALERERAAALDAQQRAAAQEREGAAAAAAQQRAVAQERERVVKQERERAAAQERERAAAAVAPQRAATQERERAAAVEAQRRAAALLQPSIEATRARSTGPVAIPQSIAAFVQRPPLARVAQPQPVARVAEGPPVARAAQPAFVPRVPKSSNLDNDGELVALAKLLRCGAWREGLRANDLLSAEQLPVGAQHAIQELVGTATPNVRTLGNALKRVQNKRVEGITRKLTRKIDNHGFALWQVVNDPASTSATSEGPDKVELLRGALTGMGYRLAETNHAISALRDCIETEALADLVRKALGVLRQRPPTGSEGKRK